MKAIRSGPEPCSVVPADHLTAGAGAQGPQGGQRHAVAQKADRAVREDDIRSALVAAAVRAEAFVFQVAAWWAKGTRKRPGYVVGRELPVDRRQGIPRHRIWRVPRRHLAQVIQVLVRSKHALVAE